MLRPAILYSDQLERLYVNAMYDISNKYFMMENGTNFYEPLQNNKYGREFVSVNGNRVIGFIKYSIDVDCNLALALQIISFDKGKLLFVKDVLEAIHKIFTEYNMNSIIFTCIPDNPVYENYIKFSDYCNGKASGYYKDYCKLMDGELYDEAVFQIMREDYYKSKMYNRMEKRLKE